MTTTCPSLRVGKRKEVLYVGLEGRTICATLHTHRCSPLPLRAHSGDQRYVLIPVILGTLPRRLALLWELLRKASLKRCWFRIRLRIQTFWDLCPSPHLAKHF